MQILNFDGRDPYFYNPVINGNMDFWQRGQTVVRASTTSVAAQGRLADRHATVVSATTAKQLTVNRSTSLPTSLPTPAQYSMEVVNNTAVATLAAADYVTCFEHVIEGAMFAPLQGSPLTLGFWMYSSLAGVVPISLRYGTSNSYVTSITATVGWAYYTVSVATPNFTMPVDNTATLDITIGGFCGTTYQTATLNAWQTGNFLAPAAQMAFLSAANNTLRFSQVQLREGTLSASEMQAAFFRTGPTYLAELMLCQRYYEKTYPIDTAPGTADGSATTSGRFPTAEANLIAAYKVTKRAIPTTVTYSPITGAANTVAQRDGVVQDVASSISLNGTFGVRITANLSAASSFCVVHFTADADF